MIRSLIFLTLTFISSCSLKKYDDNKKAKTIEISNGSDLTEEPTKTVIDFLKWYRANMNRLGEIETINNFRSSDSAKYYSVNFNGTENYLNELKKSHYISEKYISHWRDYFKRCDENFKNNPQNDGPPEGFEFDFIMWSQEYDEDLANINKVKITKNEIDNNKGFLILEFPSNMRLGYSLTKENNNWLIDDIQNKSGE